MMNNLRFFILLLLFSLLGTATAYGQDYQEMRAQIIQQQKSTRAEIEELDQQIQTYEKRLERADEKYEQLYEKYQNLKNLIALQDQKLSKLQAEQSQIQEEIEITSRSLEQKEEELEQLIENHKKTLSYLYKHGRTSQLALVLSASSINQMLVRSFYLKKFNSYRENQAQDIRETREELKQNREQLVEAQDRNKDVLEEIKEEKSQLAEKKKQQEQNVSLLRENRDQIKSELEKRQDQKKELNRRLSELIQEEEKIREQRERQIRQREAERKRKLSAAKEIKNDAERAREMAKYSQPVRSENFMDSESLKQIEQQFAQNKGQIPWPVDSRTVSEHFGNRRHPVYGTVTPHPGIEIVTDSAASVRAVHPGYVFAIQPFPGFGDVVLVKHGRFITAYGNLSQIRVRKNQILEQGDVVGLAGDTNSALGESLFFLIRENNDNLDPEKWLRSGPVSSNF